MERGEGGRGGGGGGGGTGRFTIPSKGLSSPSSYVFAQEITDGRGSVKREIHLRRLCLAWNVAEILKFCQKVKLAITGKVKLKKQTGVFTRVHFLTLLMIDIFVYLRMFFSYTV